MPPLDSLHGCIFAVLGTLGALWGIALLLRWVFGG
jgi:hypothetical protein